MYRAVGYIYGMSILNIGNYKHVKQIGFSRISQGLILVGHRSDMGSRSAPECYDNVP